MQLVQDFTSTGSKFWNHPEALEGLRTGKPKPVVTHLMLCDACNHSCAFCSVQTREGNTLRPEQIEQYIETLVPLGLKAVILSGGGNPILYRKDEWDFNHVVDYLHKRGLQIGVITNGMPLVEYDEPGMSYITDWGRNEHPPGRRSWKTVHPATLDKCTWIRISMSGLDHKENEVYVPDIDKTKTTLGFSYVAHDIYEVPEEPNHGKVSTEEDLQAFGGRAKSVLRFEDRIQTLTQQIGEIVRRHQPVYVRLLPNCLQPDLIKGRCQQLQKIADEIDPTVVFVQYKPPEAPPSCYLGYIHPVLNSDGYVYPCDSCVLNAAAGHKFAVPWRVCRWDEVGEMYRDRNPEDLRSLIKNPWKLCPGCVFHKANTLLTEIRFTTTPLQAPQPTEHPNFV